MFGRILLGLLMLLLSLSVLYVVSTTPIRRFPTDTADRVLRAIVERADTISAMRSPSHALLSSRECQASLDTLLSLAGKERSEIDRLSGIDTEHLQNILAEQERQIRTSLHAQTPT